MATISQNDPRSYSPPAPTFFESIALPLLARGLKVAPCYPRSKEVHTRLVPKPLEMLSDDPAQIRRWAEQEPESNVCVYALQEEGGLCFLDNDAGYLREAYQRETKRDFQTLFVRSSIRNGVERGHWYFLQTDKTRALAKNITEDTTGKWFSFRVKNFYVVSAGSIHPDTGEPYAVREDLPVIPMPDVLLDWLLSKLRREPKRRVETIGRGKIPKGQRYPALMREVGRIWQRGTYSRDLTIKMALAWARENLEGDYDEAKTQKEIENLIDTYEPGDGTLSELDPLAAKYPQVAATLKEFNEKFYVVEDFGGKCRVCWEDSNASFKLNKQLLNHQSFEDFRNRFMHQNVQVGEETRENDRGDEYTVPKYESKGKVWLYRPGRRQYREVQFAPNTELEPEIRNLWQGFAFEPKRGDCSKYLAHVRDNICQKDEDYYKWLIAWMAYAIQNPAEQGHVAIVLRGAKGVGKNVFAEAFNELWGRHGIVLSNEKQVTTNFNAHFMGKCSLVADESFFAGDPKQMRLLKGLITGNTIAIELKGVNVMMSPNFLHFIIISNDEWIVSATGDERRFFALQCGDEHREDFPYFEAIDEELKNGGYEALLYYLLNEVDLEGFNVRQAPHTEMLHDQMAESAEGASRIWLECLISGELPGPEPNDSFEPAIKNDDGSVWLHLQSFLDRALKRHPKLMGRVSIKHLSSLLGKNKNKNSMGFKRAPRRDPKEPRRWDIPRLAECRQLWDEKKFPVEWPDPENPEADNDDEWTCLQP
jgi:hypothetical protein